MTSATAALDRRGVPADCEQLPSRFTRFSRLLVAIPTAVILFEGWSRRWVADDAYIDFRVVSNLVSGYGPVYNRGERVEVYTDPLWVGILAAFHWLAFLPVEWWAVLLGLSFSVAGVWWGGRAGQLLSRAVEAGSGAAEGQIPRLVVPLGMLMFCSIDAAWDFSTSGLETGLIFAWMGGSYVLLVSHTDGRRTSTRALLTTSLVMGLGPLIRPDLILFSLPFLAGLIAVSTTATTTRSATWARAASILSVAGALPVLYELWRMAYFAMVVPNTALAKTAASSWWSQGLLYLRDMIGPYLLWIPLCLAAVVVARRLGRLTADRRYRLTLVVAAPLIGALLDGGYVVRVGGDFMHARMLLPAVFGIGLTFWVPLRTAAQISLASFACCWSVSAIAFLHYPQRSTIVNGIANERAWYINQSSNPHPVTPDEFTLGHFEHVGISLNRVTGTPVPASQAILLLNGQQGNTSLQALVPRILPEKVIAPVANVGLAGLAAGPNVYIYDELSLSNPVGSHLRELYRIRPGHSQEAPIVWMDARFLPASEDYVLPVTPTVNAPVPQPDQAQVEAARAALSCGEMGRYLRAIDSPLTLHRMVSNLLGAIGFTTFRINPIPAQAAKEACRASK